MGYDSAHANPLLPTAHGSCQGASWPWLFGLPAHGGSRTQPRPRPAGNQSSAECTADSTKVVSKPGCRASAVHS